MIRKVLVILSVCVYNVISSSVDFIEPCREGDQPCLLRSAARALPVLAAGVPALGINPLDPMRLGRVRTDNAGLTMEFRNTIIKGLRDSHIVKLARRGHHLDMVLKCSLEMRGDYTIAGRLLVMPIEGDGKYRIRIRDMVVNVLIDFGEKQVGGEMYWTVDKWSQTSKVETGADFRFQNLFKGNKQLSDGVHEFANSNWREIFAEVAPPMVEKTVGQIVAEVTKLFNKVPIRDLILN